MSDMALYLLHRCSMCPSCSDRAFFRVCVPFLLERGLGLKTAADNCK
jgi:hypothetical protein